MKKYAIILAGGTGSRMKGDLPKQFLMLNGKPLITYSVEAFYQSDPAIQLVVAVHPDYFAAWDKVQSGYLSHIPVRMTGGGETRFHSVKNGLNLILEDGMVAVHDAARSMADSGFISQLFAEAEMQGSAVPGIPVNDTVRMLENGISRQLNREDLRAIQTPQVYRVSELKRAYEIPFRPAFTDDASVMEEAGFPLHITSGRTYNLKVTGEEDFLLAGLLLARRKEQEE
jgi:2-C-methyl-D-erythritol 4-phosphate cytidylyltransferase